MAESIRGIPPQYLTKNGTWLAIYENEATGDSAVHPAVAQAIIEGYACGDCREVGRFRGVSLPNCPFCGAPTGVSQIIEPWWT